MQLKGVRLVSFVHPDSYCCVTAHMSVTLFPPCPCLQDEDDDDPHARRKRLHLLRRLRKACIWSNVLKDLCHECADKYDATQHH